MEKNNKAAFEKALDDMTVGRDVEWFDYVLGLYDLRGYYEAYDKVTLSRKSLPGVTYHNDYHMKLVVLSTCEGALHSHFTAAQTRLLMVAAMFHDANHSCGGIVDKHWGYWCSDNYNINNAVHAFQDVQQNHTFQNKLSKENADEVGRLIRTTEFPRTPYAGEKNELAGVLMDADYMTAYCLNKDHRLALYLGLKNETRQGWSMKDFIEEQVAFSSKVSTSWKTRWARVKSFKANWPAQFREISYQLQEHEKRQNLVPY